ncbi:PREDICTED: ankyrin repeat and KH domain-containing protein mask-like [Camelina sativa]|uniref:Ankyrin repeat and KH domain-containing protein mask-like n=1 Tax=Camelina sativa TaxID=90675 RepID=A0ABM0XBJ8_CAMSA|nr:PREDICTED: ankyrin repeat and KH domain-containing protein mask-like [Camelina sativa]
MPSFAFGSHHHLSNPRDSPYSVEISADGGSSDLDSLSEVDLESGCVPAPEKKLHSGGKKKRTRRRKRKKKKKKKKKSGRDCRICHLPLEINQEADEAEEDEDDGDTDSDEDEDEEDEEEEYYGLPLQLGCSCKGDLGVAHSKCAETWFKIKGNMTCEICGAMALNVAGEQSNPESTASAHSQAAARQPQTQTEPRGIWHGRPVMNFLLAAMVFAFIVSWLFHFKVLK